jgi:hypothetical protein
LTALTICSQFFQSCMFSHEHCHFSLLSLSVEIENVILRLRLRLWLILKNDYINMFNCF